MFHLSRWNCLKKFTCKRQEKFGRSSNDNDFTCLDKICTNNGVLHDDVPNSTRENILPSKSPKEELFLSFTCKWRWRCQFNEREYSTFKNSQISTFLSFCDYYRDLGVVATLETVWRPAGIGEGPWRKRTFLSFCDYYRDLGARSQIEKYCNVRCRKYKVK